MNIPVPAAQNAAATAPLFAEPEIGKLYMQMGAVSKGMAVIMAEGLRSHGFRAFVAPGPSVNVFRVLVGPLNEQDYLRAKAAADSIDLGNFARRFEVSAADTPGPKPSAAKSSAAEPQAPAVSGASQAVPATPRP